MKTIRIFRYFTWGVFLAVALGACGDEYDNPIVRECKELCEVGTACLEGEELDVHECRVYCGIEQWNRLCLDCRLIDDCHEMTECVYEYCDMRPMTDQCVSLCDRAKGCLDEYLDEENCVSDCTTDKNMFDCLECLQHETCTEFINCGNKYCQNDWLRQDS